MVQSRFWPLPAAQFSPKTNDIISVIGSSCALTNHYSSALISSVLLILLSIILIVFLWRSTTGTPSCSDWTSVISTCQVCLFSCLKLTETIVKKQTRWWQNWAVFKHSQSIFGPAEAQLSIPVRQALKTRMFDVMFGQQVQHFCAVPLS